MVVIVIIIVVVVSADLQRLDKGEQAKRMYVTEGI